MGVKDLAGAEQLVEKFIPKGTECFDFNDVMFVAASDLYKINGNQKAGQQINKAIEKYEKMLEEFLLGEDEDELDFGDMDLPF